MTRLTTPFGFHSTAADVVAGIDLSGKRMIVTGAASGIVVETARALAGAGAEVTLAVRDAEAGARAAAEISAGTGNRQLHVVRLDLADRSSIAEDAAGGGRHVRAAGRLAAARRDRRPLFRELQRGGRGRGQQGGHGRDGALRARSRDAEMAPAVAEIVEAYVRHRLMPEDPTGDALHLALASYHNCEFLVTWNCQHLANANKYGHIRRVNNLLGL